MSHPCEVCRDKKGPITVCVECDREYIMIDVRFYRALRAGTFKLKKKIQRLEKEKARKQ